jgi:hypothetical protein
VVGDVFRVFESLKQRRFAVVVMIHHCVLHSEVVKTLYLMVAWRSHRGVCCGMRSEHSAYV